MYLRYLSTKCLFGSNLVRRNIYVYMFVYVYVYKYTYNYVFLHIHEYMRMCVLEYIHTHVYMYVGKWYVWCIRLKDARVIYVAYFQAQIASM